MDKINIYEVETTNLGSGGDAVAYLDEKKIYVPFALHNEKVKIKKIINKRHNENYELIEVLKASPDRIKPFCSKFSECGGCSVQHLEVEKYKKWKESIILESLKNSKSDCKFNSLQTVNKGSRRRISISYKNFKGRIELGFYKKNSKFIADIDHCPLLTKKLNFLLKPLRELLKNITDIGQSGHFFITDTENGIDMAFCPARKVNLDSLFEIFSNFADKYDIARITRAGKETIISRYNPFVKFLDYKITFPPAAFLQPSKEGEILLQNTVEEFISKYASKAKRFADLFCGLGTFTLMLAKNSQVLASDVFSPSLNELKNIANNSIKIIERNLIDNPLTENELKNIDLLILDPPRSGAKMQIHEIVKTNIEYVIYISCNPASFFRDLEILEKNNYNLLELSPIDQFPYTNHLELVTIFKKSNQS